MNLLYKQSNMTKKSPCSPLRDLDNMANGNLTFVLAENKPPLQLLLQQTILLKAHLTVNVMG